LGTHKNGPIPTSRYANPPACDVNTRDNASVSFILQLTGCSPRRGGGLFHR
jgi:hypothetical protein